jgi:AraC-like DNA-binding protein
LAGPPKELIENPDRTRESRKTGRDVLSDVLRTVRLSGSVQFCLVPTGSWQTDVERYLAVTGNNPPNTMPLHIVVDGTCWLKAGDEEAVLVAGDLIALPFGASHQLGFGSRGRLISPLDDLPPKPWYELPVLRYGEEKPTTRLLCGYLRCDALGFHPLRNALPQLLHVKTRGKNDGWLAATINQMVSEVDHQRPGGSSMLERLTEIIFIEILRHIATTQPASNGWLAALADPSLGKCLYLIHSEPKREWSIPDLSSASGLSRSTLTEKFEAMLQTSPMRYVRDWRLYLASVSLRTTNAGIAAIGTEAGYGTEAAFNRAFSRAYGSPPALWRQTTRQSRAG